MASKRDDPPVPEQLARLRRLLSGAEPEGKSWLVVPSAEHMYSPGTAVPIVGTQFGTTSSGLLVPSAIARGPVPLDLMATYITADEVYGQNASEEQIAMALSQVPLFGVLAWCGSLLAQLQSPDGRQELFDAGLVSRWFPSPMQAHVRNLVDQGRVLCTPQAVLQVAKLAIKHSPSHASAAESRVDLAALLLSVQAALNQERGERVGEIPGIKMGAGLAAEIISNQDFNSSIDESGFIARFDRRWRVLPGELQDHPKWVDLEALYEEVTGVPLVDLMVFGTAVWATVVVQSNPLVSQDWVRRLGWTAARVEALLGLLSMDVDTLRESISSHEATLGKDWSFDPLRRYPLAILPDGRLLILSPNLLLQRVFGWFPLLDLESSLKDSGRSKDASRAVGFFRHVCESYALESIRQIVGESKVGKRVWDGEELRAAYGSKGKLADAAVDYGDSWVVVEVSTRRLTREVVVGGSVDDLVKDIRLGVEEKVAQIDGTIRRLQEDESRLTGHPAAPRRRYFAVLVITEGFPVNPVTTAAIAEGIERRGFIQDPRVGPLHILSQQDLDHMEGATDQTGNSLVQLLEGHESGNLRNVGMTEWLLVERQLSVARPERLNVGSGEVFRLAVAALELASGDASPDRNPDDAGEG